MEFTVYPMFVLNKVIFLHCYPVKSTVQKDTPCHPVATASCSFKKYRILLPDEPCRLSERRYKAMVTGPGEKPAPRTGLTRGSVSHLWAYLSIGLVTICWGVCRHVSFIMRRNPVSVKLKNYCCIWLKGRDCSYLSGFQKWPRGSRGTPLSVSCSPLTVR